MRTLPDRELDLANDIIKDVSEQFGLDLKVSDIQAVLGEQAKFIMGSMRLHHDIHLIGLGKFEFNAVKQERVILRAKLMRDGLSKEDIEKHMVELSKRAYKRKQVTSMQIDIL